MNIYLDMVGCRLNQSEIETYARQFRLAGHNLVPSAEQADLVVVNSCSVTAAAASNSRQKVRQAFRLGAGEIVVTGCWATLNPQEASGLPGVSRVVVNQEKDTLVQNILHIPATTFEHQFIQREPIPGSRLRTRAFIKAQDGCDNHCTYCVTTLARGAGRSRVIPDVLEDIRSALEGGSQEIVLTGVHLGSWGHDFDPPLHLLHLVQAILKETDIPRLRLSSLEPWDIPPGFFELWQDARLCRHLHLPLQSGSGATLRRMARKITPEAYKTLVAQARAAIPGAAITTDIIAGFPGETETEFYESVKFVKEMNFAGGHVFSYSARPGTAAARLPGQIPHLVCKQRNAEMRQTLADGAHTYRIRQLKQELEVLWESATQQSLNQWEMSGLSDNYLRVAARSSSPCWNQIMPVYITETTQDGLVGEITHL